MKRVVVISDLHCGHVVGLVPPGHQTTPPPNARHGQIVRSRFQRELWAFYSETIEKLKPIDVLVVNGDAVDGKGERSGGTEIIAPDMQDQCDMAVACILECEAKKIVMTFGTAYHVGQDTDWERLVANEVEAEIGGHEWIEVEGVVFDCKHKVGASQIPHGRHTAVSRERLWSEIWAERGGGHKSDVLIRSHVHFFGYSGRPGLPGRPLQLDVTTAALQGLGSKYGVRQCSGLVDVGLLHFDCHKGGYSWQVHLLQSRNALPRLVKC